MEDLYNFSFIEWKY